MQWALFLVGDATDEIIASFPPSIMNSLPSESTKTLTPTEQALSTYFKPVSGSNQDSIQGNASSIQDTIPSNPTAISAISNKPVIELDSRPAETASTPTETASTPIAKASSTMPDTIPSNNPLVCNQCGIGPFENKLKLEAHKTAFHPKKAAVRRKKPIGNLTGAPAAPVSVPTPAPIPTPIPFAASHEQATLTTPVEVQAPTVPSAVLAEPYYIPSTTPSRALYRRSSTILFFFKQHQTMTNSLN